MVKRRRLFIRPANIDGDVVSIRQALFVSTPIIPSDAVPCSEHRILFKNRDMKDSKGISRLRE